MTTQMERDALAILHKHPGRPCWDPDGDGDCDLTPEGDQDHDYWTSSGHMLRPGPGAGGPTYDSGETSSGRPLEQRAKLTAAERDALPDSAFALPGRRYPIHDENHARAALSEVAQHGTAEEKAKVRAAVHKRYPHIGAENSVGASGQDRAAFELRKRRRASMVRQCERRGLQMEVRAKPDGTGSDEFVFEGYASLFDTPFPMYDRWGEPYTEIVKPGAFTRSLQRPDLDVPFLIGHDDKRLALARTRNGTMQLSQDSRGMHVRAVMDGRRSDVRDLAYAVERGDNDEMSIGFITEGQKWSDDFETRSMLDLNIHRGDVSSVPLAAIAQTAGSTIRMAESLSRTAAERRGNPADQDFGDASDYNPSGATKCVNSAGCSMTHVHQAPAAKLCNYCGDALVRLNEDGVPGMEEEQGAMATLAQRRRELELLALRR